MRSLTLSLAVVLLPWCAIAAGATEDNAFSVVGVLAHKDALDRAHDVELAGDMAYVPGKGGSLAAIDVGDPARPKLVWFRHDAERLSDAETVLVNGDRLFLGTCDFFSIDTSDCRKPVFEGHVSEQPQISRINGMVRRGDTIIAANKDGWIDAFDVSNPVNPELLGAVAVREKYGIDFPHDVDLFGNYVVVADPQQFGRAGKPGQIAVIRAFADGGRLLPPEAWELAGVVRSEQLAGANRVAVSGQFAFVGGSNSGVHSNFVVVDLGNPSKPQQVASLRFSDREGPNGLCLAGNIVFLAGGQTVEAIDITLPAAPVKLAAQRFPRALPTGRDNAHDLVYRDSYLYVTGQNDDRFVVLRVDSAAVRRLAGQAPQHGSAAGCPNRN